MHGLDTVHNVIATSRISRHFESRASRFCAELICSALHCMISPLLGLRNSSAMITCMQAQLWQQGRFSRLDEEAYDKSVSQEQKLNYLPAGTEPRPCQSTQASIPTIRHSPRMTNTKLWPTRSHRISDKNPSTRPAIDRPQHYQKRQEQRSPSTRLLAQPQLTDTDVPLSIENGGQAESYKALTMAWGRQWVLSSAYAYRV